jgi:hypothetical protein
MVSAWREAPHLYSARERAALAWAEAVTRLVDQQVPDAVYDQAHREFSETELGRPAYFRIPSEAARTINLRSSRPACCFFCPPFYSISRRELSTSGSGTVANALCREVSWVGRHRHLRDDERYCPCASMQRPRGAFF